MNSLWNKLLENNLVTGAKPDDNSLFIPWYIRLMQGFAGWLAAVFIISFFAAAFGFLFKQPSSGLLISVGVLCSVGAYVLMRLQKNDFLNQLAMAFSLSGQLMVAFALFLFTDFSIKPALFIMGIYQLALAVVVPQYAHRLLSTSFGLLSLLILFNLLGFYGIGSAMLGVLISFIWLKENSWGKFRELWQPIGYGVAIILVFSSGFLLTGKHLLTEFVGVDNSWLFNHAQLVSSLLIALLFVNVVVVLLKENNTQFDSKTAILSLIAAIGLVLVSFYIYGISTGLLLLIIGFARQRIVLVVLGGLSVVSFFSWYYYHLQVSLLFKSLTLMLMGLLALGAWVGLHAIYGHKSENKLQSFQFKAIGKNTGLVAATLLLVIIAINVNIQKKQDLIENGIVIVFELAPVDPRSLMQGDYMQLRFDVAQKILTKLSATETNIGEKASVSQGFVVLQVDDNRVASFVDLFHNQPLQDKQFVIPYKQRQYQIILTTDAFYFQEGKAEHFQQAKYGQFRMAESGEMILVNMLDKDFNIL